MGRPPYVAYHHATPPCGIRQFDQLFRKMLARVNGQFGQLLFSVSNFCNLKMGK